MKRNFPIARQNLWLIRVIYCCVFICVHLFRALRMENHFSGSASETYRCVNRVWIIHIVWRKLFFRKWQEKKWKNLARLITLRLELEYTL